MSSLAALPFRSRPLGGLGALTTLLVAVLLSPLPTSSAMPNQPVADGSSVATAAASCWEIHRNDPAAPSGTYWLWTPALMAPQQFHCDMERKGGGWVLIGRGREGWQTTYNGVGDPAELLAPRTDFYTTQLSAQTVDGLLDDGPVSGLREGIRVRRAMDRQGTKWQEVRFTLPERGRWAWTFGASHPLGHYVFTGGGAKGKGTKGTSRSFGLDDRFRRVITTSPEKQRYTQSFAYGPDVTAGPDSNSFLWSSEPGQGFARPYAEAYIRPRLTSSDFAQIPDAGTPAVTRMAVASTWAAPTEWGVTGLPRSYSDEGHVEVQAFAEWNGRIFVGGNFQTVQRGADATGPDRVSQRFLAAFDMESGDYLPDFTPTLDGEVESLEVLPGGRLAVGGAFSKVDGESRTGVAVLDADTGALDSAFDLQLRSRSAGAVDVRDLEVVGDQLYVAGVFARATGGSPAVATRVGNAVRVSVTTGEPDAGWRPTFDDAVNDSTPAPNGSKMYFAGYFKHTDGFATRRVAVISTKPGAKLVSKRWKPTWSQPVLDYQRAIAVGQGRIWVGGSQHSLFGFTAKRYVWKSSSITAHSGGDFQTVSLGDGVVYGGCHCNEFNYQDADTFGRRIRGWSQADKINWVGAYTRTGRYVPEFSPLMRSAAGAGVWATLVDSTGALWAGGDLRSVQTGQTSSQWIGSFVRFPMQDHHAPQTPANAAATVQEPGTVQVTWGASTDETSAVSYEVLRNDRVVAVTDGTSVQVPGSAGDRFFVRAVDATGNRSESTPVVTPA